MLIRVKYKAALLNATFSCAVTPLVRVLTAHITSKCEKLQYNSLRAWPVPLQHVLVLLP
jgi:hypothetical protein